MTTPESKKPTEPVVPPPRRRPVLRGAAPYEVDRMIDAAADQLVAQWRLGGGTELSNELVLQVLRADHGRPDATFSAPMRADIAKRIKLRAIDRGMPNPDAARIRTAQRRLNGAD